MKQYNYKPRSNSTSSQDGSAAGSPPKSDSKQTPTSVLGQTSASGPTAGAAAGRRRSSASDKFAGLSAHKRGSQDEGQTAKKASFTDQQAGQGMLGNMWNSFTKGEGK